MNERRFILTHSLDCFSSYCYAAISTKSNSGPLPMTPDDQAGPVTRMNFALGSYEKLRPGFRDGGRPTILGMSTAAKFEKQSKHDETHKF